MENSDIKNKIHALQSGFDINFSVLSDKNAQIIADILSLQHKCTHRQNDGNYALTKDKTCWYCGKVIEWES